jgi:hypothetical protein
MSVFPPLFFCFIGFRAFFSDGSSKALQKTFYKTIASKSFCKEIDKKKTPDFFCVSFITFLGRFSLRGVQKHGKKLGLFFHQPGTFLASEEPTNHVWARRGLFFECPLAANYSNHCQLNHSKQNTSLRGGSPKTQ